MTIFTQKEWNEIEQMKINQKIKEKKQRYLNDKKKKEAKKRKLLDNITPIMTVLPISLLLATILASAIQTIIK